MRKVIYEKLRVQNFLSIGNNTVEIDFQNGLNQITGVNLDNPERKNAIGKSSLIEAYYYALFGTTIRSLKKEQVINNVTKGSGSLDLFFTVQTETGTTSYKIHRKLKPSTVELWKLGDKDENISRDSIANTNKYICDLIGSNPIISKSCDIISLTDNVSFMAMKPEDKRKFNEDIFTLEIFGKMLKDLKDRIKHNNLDIKVAQTKSEEIMHSSVVLHRQYNTQKENIEKRSAILEEKKIELGEKLTSYNDEYNSFEFISEIEIQDENNKLHEAWLKIDGLIGDVGVKISVESISLEQKLRDISKWADIKEVKCDKCLQNITHSHINALSIQSKKRELEIQDIQDGLSLLGHQKVHLLDKKGKVQSKIASNMAIINKIKSDEARGLELKNLIALTQSHLDSLDIELDQTGDSLDSLLIDIEEAKTRLNDQLERANELKQLADDYETCKFIIGDDGVKSVIIKRLLDMLNAKIQYYISKLGMTMKCKFDEYFEDVIKNDKGDVISYWNLSGGERRTVDIACAWAFKDIKRKISGVTSNVEFLDEIFDSAFDERGLDLLIEVLKDRIEQNNLSCYAISHRKETEKHVDGEVIILEKANRLTKRVI